MSEGEPRSYKRLTVRFSRYENVLGWECAVATSRAWRGILRAYGDTRDEAFLALEDTVRREVGSGTRIVWKEEATEGYPL